MIINGHKSIANAYKGMDRTVRTFADLETNSEQIKSDDKRMQIFDYCLATIEFNMSSVFNQEVDEELLFEIFCKLTSKQSQIVGFFDWHKTQVIGSGLYIETSGIGHSCVPNTAPVFDGSLMVIKAIKSIDVGEEVTMNYCHLEVCRDKRQKMLRNVFYKECVCFKCVCDDANVDYKEFDAIRNKIMSEVYQNRYPKWTEVSKLCDKWMDMCNTIYGEYHPQNVIYLLRVFSYKMQDKDRREIVKLMSKLNVVIERMFGKDHTIFKMFEYCLQYKVILDFE